MNIDENMTFVLNEIQNTLTSKPGQPCTSDSISEKLGESMKVSEMIPFLIDKNLIEVQDISSADGTSWLIHRVTYEGAKWLEAESKPKYK